MKMPPSVPFRCWRVRWAAVLLVAALLVLPSHAQQPFSTDDFTWYCSFDGSPLPRTMYQFESDQAARDALARLLRYTGLAQNFVIQAVSDVENAAALVRESDGLRYILYNQQFMRSIANVNRDWAALSILAHEVGHHLQGHTLLAGGSRPPIELEADRFSGFILERMGASLDDAQAAMKSLASDEGSDTHPGQRARLAAITNGWIESCELVSARLDPDRCVLDVEVPEEVPADDVRTPDPMATELDFRLPATFGEADLAAGFTPDPYRVGASAGGSIDSGYIGGGCVGYAAAAPDFRLRWSGTTDELRILFRADAGDATLLVNMPDGSWMCNDDGGNTLNPKHRRNKRPFRDTNEW